MAMAISVRLAMSMHVCLAVSFLASIAHGQSPPASRSAADALIAKLAGQWEMVGNVRGKAVSYNATGTPTLGGRYIELHMRYTASRGAYEARVFIGSDTLPGRIIVHWLDNTGAAFSIPHGTGYVRGDTLRFEFAYSNGPFRDTFVHHPATDTWQMVLESGSRSGSWSLFASYVARRR